MLLLLVGLCAPAAWLALPLDVSHPASLSHREAPAQAAVGSADESIIMHNGKEEALVCISNMLEVI